VLNWKDHKGHSIFLGAVYGLFYQINLPGSPMKRGFTHRVKSIPLCNSTLNGGLGNVMTLDCLLLPVAAVFSQG
jgi:hypothetical protein